MNYTYILTCADGTLYCGWTNDLDKRLKAHNAGRGAKYTKPRRPVALSYYEAFETKGEAMGAEEEDSEYKSCFVHTLKVCAI